MKDLENILKNIKNKVFQPIYFFHGEEPYFMDIVVKYFEDFALTDDEKAFNQIVIYGKDTSYEEIFALARQYPMIGERQLIVVKEAQNLKMSDGASGLLKYVENPVESTVLVIAHKYKKIDSRKKFAKLLNKKSFLHYSEPIKDYQLADWIQKQIGNFGIKSESSIPYLLAEYLGNDLSRIHRELSKLKLILKENEELSPRIIELHIGISKDYNVFELQKAIGAKDAEKSMKIAFYMGKNMKTNPFIMIIGNLFNFFSNLLLFHSMKGESPANIATAMGINPYFLKDYEYSAKFYSLKHTTRAISILREMDIKSKGIGSQNVDDSQLLIETVYKILNIDQIKVNI